MSPSAVVNAAGGVKCRNSAASVSPARFATVTRFGTNAGGTTGPVRPDGDCGSSESDRCEFSRRRKIRFMPGSGSNNSLADPTVSALPSTRIPPGLRL